MVRQNKVLKKPQAIWKGLVRSAFLLIFCMIAWQGSAQFKREYNIIYLSGQITNCINGIPIANQQIFISSDSLQNNGFSYISTTVSDPNGFYSDTIATPLRDGNLKIYLYDYCNKLVEVIQYYRFILEEEEYFMFADFQIFDPIITVNYQADFVAESDPYGNNPLLVTLRDISTGFLTKSWTWDFGDGTSSLEQNPNHEYSESGIYRVSLTVFSQLATHELHISSTITKQVKVGLREYHHIGGHVFAGYFPIDLGLAYLYMYGDNDELIPIDTTEIDTLGYYYFYQVPQGKYITKARLQAGSQLYGQFIPTYIGDVFIWEQAEIVNLENDNWECDINLIQSSGSPPGESKIIGQISYDTASTHRNLVPAEDIEIVLLNDHGTCLTCSLSDIEGFFQFAGIDYGTYQLYPDVVGLRNSTMLVTISEGNPVISDVSLVINREEITFSVNEHQSEFIEGEARIYPNPAYNLARLLLDVKKHSSFTVVVTDHSGRTVNRKDINLDQGSREITLDLSILSAGMYQVVVIPQDGVRLTSKLMKLN